jgi:hypothetical protein
LLLVQTEGKAYNKDYQHERKYHKPYAVVIGGFYEWNKQNCEYKRDDSDKNQLRKVPLGRILPRKKEKAAIRFLKITNKTGKKNQ